MANNPNNVREEVASNTSSNNGASVASSVTFRTNATANSEEENWNNREEEENWSNEENENAGIGATFSVPLGSSWFRQAGSRELFNKTSAELIAAHPEWNLNSVSGNPLAYGNGESEGYICWVVANRGIDPPGLFAAWPGFAAAMEERLPGLGLPADLQPLTGWHPPPPMTNYMRLALERMGGRGRYSGKRKSRKQVKRKTLKKRGKSRRRRHSRRT